MTHMAMKWYTDSLRCDESASSEVISVGSGASTLPMAGPALSQELNATRRVYSQPMLRQKLECT